MRQEAGINNAMIIAPLALLRGMVSYDYIARLSLNLTLPTHAGQ